jgi:hypothetical protein
LCEIAQVRYSDDRTERMATSRLHFASTASDAGCISPY